MFLYLAVLTLWLLYKWLIKDLDYFEKLGVPHEKPLPFFGNAFSFVLKRKSLVELFGKKSEKFKSSKIVGFMSFMTPSFYVKDADLIKRITIKDFDHFVNHGRAVTQVDSVVNRTLFALRDKQWKHMRMKLSPIFTSSKMKMMYGLLLHEALDVVNYFEERANRGEMIVPDVLDIFNRYTANGISSALLGFEADCVRNENSETYKFMQKMLHDYSRPIVCIKILLSLAFPNLYKVLGLQIVSQEVRDFFKSVVIETMNERDRLNTSRPDAIQLMLQAKKGQLEYDGEDYVNEFSDFSIKYENSCNQETKKNALNFSDEDWIAQGYIFFGAGFDTAANLLQSLFFELALNPEIQRELQDEIGEVALMLDNKPISYETLHKMKFLDMVISETMRKWPPAPIMDRECSKDYEIDLGGGKRFTIKKGQVVYLPFCTLHHDEHYFPNPDKFDPQRFSDENRDSIVPGSYIPFGSGPRACIGGRFALMGIKLLAFTMLRKFNVKTCANTPDTLTYEANTTSRINETVSLQFDLRK